MKKFFRSLNAMVAAGTLAASTVLSSTAAFATYPTNGASEAAGSLDSTSTSYVQVGVTKDNEVEISGLVDLAYTWHITDGGGTAGVALTENFCVYASDGNATNNGTYTLTATSTYPDGSNHFRMQGITHTSNYLLYTLDFNTSVGSSGSALTSGSVTGTKSNGDTNSATCADLTNSVNDRLDVTVTQAAMIAAVPDQYADTVTFLITAI